MTSPSITVAPAAEAGQLMELPVRCERSGEWRELCDCVACSALDENRALGAVLDWQAARVGIGVIEAGQAVGPEIAPKVVVL
jgi:hypothetical protein